MIHDPDYARIFAQARIVAWQYGYACVAHGSFTRDLDLLLVPWEDRAPPDVELIVKRIAGVAKLEVKGPPSEKPHGRKSWTLLLPGFDEVRWVDVSAFAPARNLRPRTAAGEPDDDVDGGYCNVCGGPTRYGDRHHGCGRAVQAAIAAAVESERNALRRIADEIYEASASRDDGVDPHENGIKCAAKKISEAIQASATT